MTESVLMPAEDATGPDTEVISPEGTLNGGRCGSCAATSFPRAYICPACSSTDIEASALGGRGLLYSWTTVHISPSFETPYSLGYVDLPDGLRVLGQLIADPATLACDLPVQVERTDASPTGWGFRRVEGAAV